MNSYDLYKSILRGNEIEFEYSGKQYFILPSFCNGNIVGALIGEQYMDDILCKSAEDLENALIDGKPFKEIFHSINITNTNFDIF